MEHIPGFTTGNEVTELDISSTSLMKSGLEELNACDACTWKAKCDRLSASNAELYDALKHLYEQIGGLCERGKITESDLAGGFDEDIEAAIAALAKARGEK